MDNVSKTRCILPRAVSRVIRKIFCEPFSSFLGGEKCLACGKKSVYVPLCTECMDQMENEVRSWGSVCRCSVCGKPLVSEENLCTSCRKEKILSHADCVVPLFTYRLWKKVLLFAWKMEGVRSFSGVFARFVNIFLENRFGQPGNASVCIVPVPPRPGKIRNNGWDQIDELCRILHREYGWRTESPLVRLSKAQQKKLDRSNRLTSSHSSYALKPENPCIPEEVVLIDDVITTGATTESCSELLKSAGCTKITVLSLFIVD